MQADQKASDDKLTILVVEDDRVTRRIIEEILGEDYRLFFAEEGQAALELARNHEPELVVLDLMLPGMDGFEICRQMRQQPGLDQTIVIILTALTDKDSQKTGIQAGADDYLTKPFNPVDLRTKVGLMVRLRQRLLGGR